MKTSEGEDRLISVALLFAALLSLALLCVFGVAFVRAVIDVVQWAWGRWGW